MNQTLSIAFVLFLITDALGTLPSYLAQIKDFSSKRALTIAARELVFALILMVLFLYVGGPLLTLLGISGTTVEVSGGVVIFLIAIRLIFNQEEVVPARKKRDPFIVPIATPLLAGPSFFAAIIIFSRSGGVSHLILLLALTIAWIASSLVYLFGRPIYRVMGDRGILACQKLMGLLTAVVAIQMTLKGINGLLASTL